MGTHDKLPPIPSDEELAALAELAAEHPDPRSTESEVAEGERIMVAPKGFGSPTASYGVIDSFESSIGVEMIEDSEHPREIAAERERLDDEGVP